MLSLIAVTRRQLSTRRRRQLSTAVQMVQKAMESELDAIRREMSEMDPIGHVLVERDNSSGVARIVLDNEERKNGMSGRMMAELWSAVHELEHWKQGKAVVIHGKNGFFCSGGDLNLVRKIADPHNGRKMSLLMHSALTRLHTLPLLSLAAIEGMALGGGAEISTACDLRVMREDARMGFVHARIGIVAAWGGGSRLVDLVGQQMALRMMLSGKTLSAREALSVGLIDGVLGEKRTSGDDLFEEAVDWLKENYSLVDNSRETVAAVKKIMSGKRYLPLELSLREEMEASVERWGAEEHREKLARNIKHKT